MGTRQGLGSWKGVLACTLILLASGWIALAGAGSGPGPWGFASEASDSGGVGPFEVNSPLEVRGSEAPTVSVRDAVQSEPILAPTFPPVRTLASFEGLHYGDNDGITNTIAPPDVQLAVGPGHVMELVNWIGGIWTKDGTHVSTFKLQTLFRVPDTVGLGDSKLLYDATSGRWFASTADNDLPGVLLAVSDSSGPTGTWKTYNFTTPGANCPDQPHLGLSQDKVVIAIDAFTSCTGGLLGGQYWVINKADLLAGNAPRYTVFGPSNFLTSIHPVHSLTNTTTQFMVRTAPTTTIQLFEITGVPPGTVSVTTTNVAVTAMGSAVNGRQPGTSYVLDSADRRVQDGFWQAGTLWLALHDGCTPAGDSAARSCLRLTQIDTANRSVLQDFDAGTVGNDSMYPAVRGNVFGDLVVGFTITSGSTYPSAALAIRRATDPKNTLQAPRLVRAGTGIEQPPYGYCPWNSVCRYGDYYGAAEDPSNPSTIWTAAEYSTSSGWGTYLSHAGFGATLTASYALQGGGSGYTAPKLTYVLDGTPHALGLTTTPQTVSVDEGTTWNVTNPLGGSGASDRWLTGQPTEGIAGPSTTIAMTYVHQVGVSFDYSVVGGGSGFSAPWVAYQYLGSNRATPVRTAVWADANATFAFDNPLPGSGPWEGWRSGQATGVIPRPGTITATYHRQYLAGFTYAVMGGDPTDGVAPLVRCTLFGTSGSVPADGSHWVDSGSSYAYPANFTSPSTAERWIGLANVSGTIPAPTNVSAEYYHQVYFSIKSNSAKGGSVWPANSWYNASTVLTVTATPNRNWRFVMWQGSGNGSYSGPNRVATIVLAGAVTEYAVFHAGMRIRANSGGGVTYQTLNASGIVPSGGDATVYVSPGDALTLQAEPALFYSFQGWLGDRADTQALVSLVVTQPADLIATFGFNWISVAGMIGSLSLMIGATAAAVRRRKRRRKSGI